MRAAITLSHISKRFTEPDGGSLLALSDVTLAIRDGEFFIFLGPSGCGKSTLLRVMSGLDTDFTGAVAFAPGIAPDATNFVFQQFALLPWLTVEQNVGLGLLARGMSTRQVARRVADELATFGLRKFRHHYPRELSGGMRQRVGIARALATDPRILFLDEPFSELDSFIAEELRLNLLHVWEERNLTVIMVSHNIQESLMLADRIAVMTPRPGKIERIVQNRLERPRQKRSQPFFALEDKLYGLVKP